MPGQEAFQQVQKFAWVFLKENGTWRVITDSDATPAPPNVLDDIEPEIVIGQ
jgi:hypothetical protein